MFPTSQPPRPPGGPTSDGCAISVLVSCTSPSIASTTSPWSRWPVKLDRATSPELARVLDGLRPARVNLVLDVAELDFVDSTGLHLMLAAHEWAAPGDFGLVVAGARRTTMRALRAARP